MAESTQSFYLLDERIQRFIWNEKWTELHDIQELAIPEIIPGNHDVILAAATAAGKTEAAFFPILTKMLEDEKNLGLTIYISPLKALINDQFGRLTQLCEDLEVPVWPWHGDISSSLKIRFLKKPHGILLITPESLEATLCNRGSSVSAIFHNLKYFVVDELHSFIGSERGKQLQMLMHRIEYEIGHQIPRIGLSATLGDMKLAAEFLRPGSGEKVTLLESKISSTHLKISVKGYIAVNSEDNDIEPLAYNEIAQELFKSLRGSNNLIFPNSRKEVERYTHLLTGLCSHFRVPNEFWPHHGSLSREIRAETEAALKRKDVPANAICTNTLELGIDIGAVKSIAQIGPPFSVASLRQRLGRSGRRKGEPSILRGFCIEDELNKNASLPSLLRLKTIEMIAIISLLLERWCEPPAVKGMHLSTLIQQLLSLIAQKGGITASEAYKLLCSDNAPFSCVDKNFFIALLRHLASKDILMQESSGLLLHGKIGEEIVNHYTFYAAFNADEEFRIVTSGKTLGSLPVSQMLIAGQRILFAGKTWLVEEISEQEKTIFVIPTKGGVPPLFTGGCGRVHSRVRTRMHEILESDNVISFLNPSAQRLVEEGRHYYHQQELSSQIIFKQGPQTVLFTWLGDEVNETIASLLLYHGLTANAIDIGVEIQQQNLTVETLKEILSEIASVEPPSIKELLAEAKNLEREKWDSLLSPELLYQNYASQYLNMDESYRWLKCHF
ncbi:MAG: DEAD/DEAH box helicase [Fibrobacteres bacterium CG2_30_45_31]|nr:MAG: DEAD/DEAH box helicase [Fibrobacteres bacterium CG2_30_45_31]